MTLRITQYGESILHDKGKAVSDFSEELANLYEEMIKAMRNAEGIGLAAQQIGKALRFCVVEVPGHPDYPITCILDGKPLSPALLMPMPLANPKIEFLRGEEFYYEEGCLSLPEIKGASRLRAHPGRIPGSRWYSAPSGMRRFARPLHQHEVDHLDGILFIDRMEKNHFAEIKDEVRALHKKTQALSQGRQALRLPRMKRTTRQGEIILEVIRSAERPSHPSRFISRPPAKARPSGSPPPTGTSRAWEKANRSWAWTTRAAPRYEWVDGEDKVHFACRSCDRLFALDDTSGEHPPPAQAPEGFEVQGFEVMLYGLCPECE